MFRLRAHSPFIAALFSVLLVGCAQLPDTFTKEEGIPLPFSLSVGRAGTPRTKMTEGITQSAQSAAFRGIEQVYILPFKTGGVPVAAGDHRWSLNLGLPQAGLPADTFDDIANPGLINTNNAHLYDQVLFRLGTDAVLVYGKAPDEPLLTGDDVALKHHNGVLLPADDLDAVVAAEEISFGLEPVLAADGENLSNYQTWKNELHNYLNAITSIKVSRNGKTYTFNDPESWNNHPVLSSALNEFTNGGVYFPLSAEIVSERLTRLYRTVYPLSISYVPSEQYKDSKGYYYVYQLAKQICSRILSFDYTKAQVTVSGSGTGTTFTLTKRGPGIYGIPSGIVAEQWQEGTKSFKYLKNINYYNPPNNVNATGLAVVPEGLLCYPPSLWYFVNSPLVTSEDEGVTARYTKDYSWSQIVGQYAAAGILSSAEAVAVQDQLQYGVALLELIVEKCSSPLKDAAGVNVAVNNSNFPLTGIILADQHEQGFDFTPKISAAMQYVYDSELSGAYLSSNRTSARQTTLVLPTLPNKKVHFALEFQNTSGKDFTGLGGCKILKGSHFYLAGVLDPANSTSNPDHLTCVFVQDRVTSVTVRFSSLEAALTVVPDLQDPQLQLGIIADFDWELSTPANVPIR